jgi:hypothetical protein
MAKYSICIDDGWTGIGGYSLKGFGIEFTRSGMFHDRAACLRDAQQELAARGIYVELSDIDEGPMITIS